MDWIAKCVTDVQTRPSTNNKTIPSAKLKLGGLRTLAPETVVMARAREMERASKLREFIVVVVVDIVLDEIRCLASIF